MSVVRPEVHVLLDGYCSEEAGCSNGFWIKASGTVTLIITATKKILVDCGDPWNGQCIIEALSKYAIGCDEITDLVITHGHSDHCGNLPLFRGATIYMADDMVRNGAEYGSFKDDHKIDDNVIIWRTPGHTDHDVSVIVSGTKMGVIAVVGDIFEHGADSYGWEAVSKYPNKQIKSREKILRFADWIIPGHGQMFKNHLKSA